MIADIDAELARHIIGWNGLSVAKAEAAIDYWVNRFDPAALRRTESRARDRHVDIGPPDDGTGMSPVQGTLFAHDAAALDERLKAMAGAVCDGDPRTIDQRRADALGALAQGADRLACACGSADCAATDAAPSSVVIYVVANEDSLVENPAISVDGPPVSGSPLGVHLRAGLATINGP